MSERVEPVGRERRPEPPEQPAKPPANRLADETSPYLRQHAHNPVDWYPWGEEAFARARAEDRPVLLSVGYAACHWCHVMERESFEDDATAALMNAHFVCVKVDREERPDVDAIYMDAVQAMTGSGGWPMTVFLAPDGRPFYAGTYFPDEDRHGMPAFRRVLSAVADAWRSNRATVEEQGRRVAEVLAAAAEFPAPEGAIDEALLDTAAAGLLDAADRTWGGFGRAPKFPPPMVIEFLLRTHLRGGGRAADALEVVTVTLRRMAAGGVHDQIGGGFHRYATDGRWHVPHFEKMLSDNALLSRAYLRAWQVTGDAAWAGVARRTLDFLLRELRLPGGGFASSQDADAGGVEGAHFVWSWEELAEVAGAEVARYLGATPEGNWEGTNVLWTPVPAPEFAAREGLDPVDLVARVEEARTRLLERREGRGRPGLDDKVIAAWNALAVSALAEAGRALGEPAYARAAEAAAAFVLSALRRDDGRLLRSWRAGRAGRPGYADDYALLADACLTLYETTFDPRWFREARALAEDLLALFADPERGGFYQSGSDAEALIVRPKELSDTAVPSGNSAGAVVLARLAALTGEERLRRAAEGAVRAGGEGVRRAPLGFVEALNAADRLAGPSREIALIGDPGDPAFRALAAEVHRRFLPRAVVAGAAPREAAGLSGEIPLLGGREVVAGRPAAFVCERFACGMPVADPGALAAELDGDARG